MRLALALAMATAVFAVKPAAAQQDPSQMKEWGAMYKRMGLIIDPYQAKLGLAHYWNTYCLNVTNAAEDAHPKDGSIPLGIANWRTLGHDEFKTDLGILEEYRTAQMMLCLADVKARLLAAERK